MRTLSLVAGAALALVIGSPLCAQQGPIVSTQEMEAALESHDRSVEADRAVVARVLARTDVRAAARAHGFADRLEEASALAGSLTGERLAQASAHARALEVQLAGGQTISFNVLTLIIILLLVIIVILIAD